MTIHLIIILILSIFILGFLLKLFLKKFPRLKTVILFSVVLLVPFFIVINKFGWYWANVAIILIALAGWIVFIKIYLIDQEKQTKYQKYLLIASQEILSKRDFCELQNFIIQTLVVTSAIIPDDFRHLDIDVDKLWLALKKEKYITEFGRVLEKFKNLESSDEFVLDEYFRDVKDAVYEVLKSATKEKGFPITHVRFFLYNKDTKVYELIKFRGKERRKQIQDTLNRQHPLIFMGDLRKDIFSWDDVNNDPSLDQKIKQKILVKMRSLGARLFVPIYVGNDPCGFIILGSKVQGREYTETDINILKIFANHVASAIENIWAYENQEKTYLQTIYSFTNFIDAKDNYTRQHSENVKNYVDRFMDKCKGKIINEEIRLSKESMETAALLHDIGKIAVSDKTLKSHRNFGKKLKAHVSDSLRRKIQMRNDRMFKELEMHAMQGANMISNIEAFRDIKHAILCHHEKWDGTGYPNKLKGKEIPIEARILSVIDTYDAITTTRLYDSAKSVEHALAILRLNKGIQFQPEIVDIFEEVIKEIHNVNDEDVTKIMENEKQREDERRKRRSKYV